MTKSGSSLPANTSTQSRTISNAHRNPISVHALDEDLAMLIGGEISGRLCEIGVFPGQEAPAIVHGMRARPKFLM